MPDDKDAVREAFMKVERALRPLTEPEKRRVIHALAVLMDYPDVAGPSV